MVSPVGGGGLLSGFCVTSRGINPSIRVFGAEPLGADDAARSKAAGTFIPQTGPNTIADGLLTSLGELTWPIIRDQVEGIFTVTEDDLPAVMKRLHTGATLQVQAYDRSNNALLATYASFAGRIRRIRYSANFARKRERWGEAMREHEAILEALRRRAGSELADILFAHLRNKRAAAVEHLKQAEPASATI